MKIIVFASGSKGNATYVEHQGTRILLDIGVSSLSIVQHLAEYHIDPNTIDAILISHTHSDHIKGLKVFVQKYHPKVYMTPTMVKELKEPLNDYEEIQDTFHIKDLEIQSIKTSHDVESYGFLIQGEECLAYITDTGYIKESYFPILENKDYYIMESNHDIEMLLNGKYPYELKQRVLSDHGHLSNEASAYYLTKIVGNHTKCVCLAHLSEENNTENLALKTLRQEFLKQGKTLPTTVVAKQKESTELVGC